MFFVYHLGISLVFPFVRRSALIENVAMSGIRALRVLALALAVSARITAFTAGLKNLSGCAGAPAWLLMVTDKPLDSEINQ